MRKLFLILFAGGLLNACATDGAISPVSLEEVGHHHKYRKQVLKWGGTSSGSETRAYFKTARDKENLRICAYYVDDRGGSQDILTRAWFDNASFVHKGKKIVSAKFITNQPRSTGAKVGCVTTSTLYKDVRLYQLRITGGEVTVQF